MRPAPPHDPAEAGTNTEFWTAVHPPALDWMAWETDTSVFNADTGETHLLSELPATALRALCADRWTFDALCVHLARLCDVHPDATWRDKIARMLSDLDDLELIERDAGSSGGLGQSSQP